MIAKKWEDLFYCLLLVLISFLTLFDLYFNVGQPAHMDGITHITTIAQYAQALREGEVRVLWTDGFANYGLPLGIMAHQLTSYLGGFIDIVLRHAVWSFNTVYFIGGLLSVVSYYAFLRLYFSPRASFAGAFLFQFAPYRILNVYIRGAQPEFFTSLFLPLTLLSIYYAVYKKKLIAIPFTAVTFGLLIITHPMLTIVYMPIIAFYIASVCWFEKKQIKLMLTLFASLFIGAALASYYIIPLLVEVKYLYYGQAQTHLTPNQYLTLWNFINPRWYYYYDNDIFHRGHVIIAGLLEFVILALATLYSLYFLFKKQKRWTQQKALFIGAVFFGIFYLLMTTLLATPLYENIKLLGNIQFPWRMMAGFIFIPPVLVAYFFSRIWKNWLIYIFILLICLLRFPQLYGKNYTAIPEKNYYFTPFNLHSINMNTIWSVQSETYPIKRYKADIIEGEGKIVSRTLRNSWRRYKVEAKEDIRMVDYTFYFPGWKVYIDNQEVPIEFQDINYRGVITYRVPKGEHTIEVRITNTKVRTLANFLSIISMGFLVIIFVGTYKYGDILKKFLYSERKQKKKTSQRKSF